MIADGVLTALKFCFLALLYLFFARALRAVLVSVRQPGAAGQASGYDARAGDDYELSPGKQGAHKSAGSPPRPAVVPTTLVVREPRKSKGKQFTIGDELTIGRAAGCHVSLPDDGFVSQLHARVYRRLGAVYIEDLGSTNGTRVNGQALRKPRELYLGDRIQFGDTTLELVA